MNHTQAKSHQRSLIWIAILIALKRYKSERKDIFDRRLLLIVDKLLIESAASMASFNIGF